VGEEQIETLHMGRHNWAVGVTTGDGVTQHRVSVPPALLAKLGLTSGEEERLVRESFGFLLEREPATAILREFSLDVIRTYFPEYDKEIQSRLAHDGDS
jgi:hypothetical protein